MSHLIADRSSSLSEDDNAVERALIRASQWQPDVPIADGLLARAVAARCGRRAAQGRRASMVVLRWAPVALTVVAVAYLALRCRTPEAADGNPGVASNHGVRVAQVADDAQAPGLPGRMAEATEAPPVRVTSAGADDTRQQHRRRIARPWRRTASLPAAPRPEVAWQTYSVPRYVTGVSTVAWVGATDANGEYDVIPAVLDVPLAECAGERDDQHPVELDVMPVRHAMEEYDD